MEWKHTSLSGIETRVLIRPRGDQLHLRASQRVGWGSPLAEASTYGLALAGLAALVAGAVAGSGGIALAVLLLSLVAAIPLILYADRTWRRKKHRELDGLADALAALVAGPAEATRALDVREIGAEPVLDPALLDEDDVAMPDATTTGQRARNA